MPCTAFFSDNEIGETIDVPEIQRWLEEVREKTGKKWVVVSSIHKPGGFFSHKKVKYYGLYVHLHGGEYQAINFYRDNSESSINTDVPLEILAAYLMGKL